MQNFLKVLFFTGLFPLILSVPRKFYLIREKKSWSEAQAYCRANHTDLAIIHSDEDMLKLRGVAQSQLFNLDAWIGLYNDIDSWRWSYENMLIESYTAWNDNQPDNAKGSETCAMTDKNKWSDKLCDEEFKVICFDDKTTGSNQYIKVDEKMTWHAAQNYCREQYTDLASVRNPTEKDVIRDKVGDGPFWFGLFRESWKWADQTEVTSSIWKHGQPDNNEKHENCGFLKGVEAEDAICEKELPFFCYSVITGQKQTIRVEVQSKQDGNDPELQSAILEKIKEKLKELGVAENTTVTWNKQPDGKVFSKKKKKN